MRKKLMYVMGLLMFVMTFGMLTAGTDVSAAGTAHTSHTMGSWETYSKATCTADKVEIRQCTYRYPGGTRCGVSEKRTVSGTKGHSWSAWTVSANPTCTASGKQKRTCSKCGTSETRDYGSPLGHSYGSWETYSKETCTADRVEIRQCSYYYPGGNRCGATEKRTVSGTRLDHSWSAWKVTVEPTDTTKGTEERKCSGCGKTETRSIDALVHTVHTYGSWEKYSKENCTSDRVEIRQCTHYYPGGNRCGATEKRTVSGTRLDHSWSAWKVTVEPTDTTKGTEERKCSGCGKTETRSIDALVHTVHTYGSWEKYSNATCTADEVQIRKCLYYYPGGNRCGATEKRTVSGTKLDHSWSEWLVTAEPVGDTPGTEERICSKCGTSEKRSYAGPSKDTHTSHTYGEWETYTKATCTADEVQIRKCSYYYPGGNRCGATEKRTVSGTILPHSWSEWKVIAEPSGNTPGTEERTCSVCGTSEKRSYEGPSKDTHTSHTYGEWETYTKATCTADEVQIRKCSYYYPGGNRCGATEKRTVSGTKLDHSWSEWLVTAEPVGDTPGTEERICSKCGTSEKRSYAGPSKDAHTSHTYGSWETYTKATCTADEVQIRKCSYYYPGGNRCGATEKRTVSGTKLDHSWSEWEVTAEPTDTAPGTEERTCSVCNKIEKRSYDGSVQETGHTSHTYGDWETYTKATCMADEVQIKHCTYYYPGGNRCGATKKQVVSGTKLPHSYGEWELSEKDSTSESKVYYRYCTNPGCSAREEKIEKNGNASVSPNRDEEGFYYYIIYNYDMPGVVSTTKTMYDGDKLVVPSRTGYTFKHWLNESTKVKYSIQSIYNMTGNLTSEKGATIRLKAVWEPIKYTITLRYSDGKTADNTIECKYDKSFKLGVPKREGYTFDGWTGRVDGNLITYSADDAKKSLSNITTKSGSEITLTAKWIEKTEDYYYVNYMDGNKFLATEAVKKGNRYSVGSKTSDGITITQWSKSKGGSKHIKSGDSITIEKNTTLYAVYYVVYYDENGNFIRKQDADTDNSVTLDSYKPQKGDEFSGWSDSLGGTEPIKGGEIITLTQNRKLYPICNALTYSISFDLDYDNKTVLVKNIKYGSGKNVTSNIETKRTGYVFKQWKGKVNGVKKTFTTEELKEKGTTLTTEPGKIIFLTAEWEKDPTYSYISLYNGKDLIKKTVIQTGSFYSLPTYSENGIEITGWKLSEDSKDVHKINERFYINGDVSFYACGQKRYYTIQFNYNDGKTETKTEKYEFGDEQFEVTEEKRKGYKFKYWERMKPDGNLVQYKVGDKIPEASKTGEVILLKAIWNQEQEHKVTVSTRGAVSVYYVKNGDTFSFPESVVEPSPERFLGWRLSSDPYGTVLYSCGQEIPIFGDRDFVDSWTNVYAKLGTVTDPATGQEYFICIYHEENGYDPVFQKEVEDAEAAGQKMLKVIYYKASEDENAAYQVVNSKDFRDEEFIREVCQQIVTYNKTIHNTGNWDRNVDDMVDEWVVHNYWYGATLNTSKQAKDVDLDSSCSEYKGKTWKEWRNTLQAILLDQGIIVLASKYEI